MTTGVMQDLPTLNVDAAEALSKYRFVRPDITTAKQVYLADIGEKKVLGVTRENVASGGNTTIILANKAGTMLVEASGVISAWAKVYPDNSGKATATPTSTKAFGLALKAAGADGDVIEVLPLLGNDDVFEVLDTFVFFDDFYHYVSADIWVATLTNSGTAVEQDAHGGVIQLNASDGTVADNDEAYLFSVNENWLFTNAKPMRFKCRIALVDDDASLSDVANVIAGFVSGANAEDTLLDTGGGPPASYSGAVFYKVETGTAWAAEVSIGATQVAVTLTSPGRPGNAVYQVLEIEFLPVSATSAVVNFYIDGTRVGQTTAWDYSGGTEMNAGVGIKNGDGTTNQTLNVDYIGVEAVR